MKRFSLFLALLLLALAAIASIVWTNRENIFSHFLSRQLHVPASLRTLAIDRKGASLERLWIGNPPQSKSSTAFAAETIRIDTSLDKLFGTPLVIDEIEINHIFVGVELYDAKGTQTNWEEILRSGEKKGAQRDYLIKTLILRDLTVEVTQADGRVKRYPTLAQMEFHNISSESGFPIDEIEKAIFNIMIKSVIKSLPDQLFKGLLPPWMTP